MAWPMPIPTYSPPSCQPPLLPHDLPPHREHALDPEVRGEVHHRVGARVVPIGCDRACHQRLQRSVVKDDVVGREPLLADELDFVVASIKHFVQEGRTLRGPPLLVKPIVGEGKGLRLLGAASVELQREQPIAEHAQILGSRFQARHENRRAQVSRPPRCPPPLVLEERGICPQERVVVGCAGGGQSGVRAVEPLELCLRCLLGGREFPQGSLVERGFGSGTSAEGGGRQAGDERKRAREQGEQRSDASRRPGGAIGAGAVG